MAEGQGVRWRACVRKQADWKGNGLLEEKTIATKGNRRSGRKWTKGKLIERARKDTEQRREKRGDGRNAKK